LPSSARCSFSGGFFGYSGSLNRSIGFSLALNGAAYFLRDIHRDGALVRFLLRYAEAGQKVNDGLGLDFELAGQLVDSYLIGVGHALRSIQLVLQN
jgi:hypothetical protein